jgi:hypothetical protein
MRHLREQMPGARFAGHTHHCGRGITIAGESDTSVVGVPVFALASYAAAGWIQRLNNNALGLRLEAKTQGTGCDFAL